MLSALCLNLDQSEILPTSNGLKMLVRIKDMLQDCKKELINLLPDDKILDWSKMKQIADDILKCI